MGFFSARARVCSFRRLILLTLFSCVLFVYLDFNMVKKSLEKKKKKEPGMLPPDDQLAYYDTGNIKKNTKKTTKSPKIRCKKRK